MLIKEEASKGRTKNKLKKELLPINMQLNENKKLLDNLNVNLHMYKNNNTKGNSYRNNIMLYFRNEYNEKQFSKRKYY
jgi:hypothetical protein